MSSNLHLAELPVWQVIGLSIVASAAVLLLAFLISVPFAKVTNLPDWVQATGAVMAIVGGFVGVLYQVDEQRRAQTLDVAEQRRKQAEETATLGRAADSLAAGAYLLVTDRLNSALQPNKSDGLYPLRGFQTTEMVASMREFEAGSLPTTLIAPFVTLRSCVFAINECISELYDLEAQATEADRAALKAKRPNELRSAVRVHLSASEQFKALDALAVAHCAAQAKKVDIPAHLNAKRDALSRHQTANTSVPA